MTYTMFLFLLLILTTSPLSFYPLTHTPFFIIVPTYRTTFFLPSFLSSSLPPSHPQSLPFLFLSLSPSLSSSFFLSSIFLSYFPLTYTTLSLSSVLLIFPHNVLSPSHSHHFLSLPIILCNSYHSSLSLSPPLSPLHPQSNALPLESLG